MKRLLVATADQIREAFKEQIHVFKDHTVATIMRQHPECPHWHFAFCGTANVKGTWFYIAGDGDENEPETQIILLEK